MSEESKPLSTLARIKTRYVEIYDFDEVKRRVSITQYLIDQGYKIHNGRTQAKWRGGDGDNVAIDDAMGTWCDHGGGGNNTGGSVIDLCMRIEGAASATEAANVLGARYGVPSKDATKRNGAKEVSHYDYTDENGKPLYCVVRYEPKDFRQFAYDDSGKRLNKLGKVRRVLYNLPQVIETANKGGVVFVAEGERDADSLNALGLTATTTSGGASGGGVQVIGRVGFAPVGERFPRGGVPDGRRGKQSGYQAHFVSGGKNAAQILTPEVIAKPRR